MSETTRTLPPRSRLLCQADMSLLMVVDIQTKLIPAIRDGSRVVWNTSRLLRGAGLLSVPVIGTEQYPKALGSTVESLQPWVNSPVSKRMFSIRECEFLADANLRVHRRTAVVCGIESHICVLQSALDLIANHWQVVVVADAVGARHQLDHDLALQRIAMAGGSIVTTEMVLFEWCETSLHPQFKAISQLVQEKFEAT